MTKNSLVSDDISEEAVITIIEVLLLSIIRAYPTTNGYRDDYKRLNEAKRALFNIAGPKGPPIDDDAPELIHMAEAYIKARGQPTIGKDYQFSWPDKSELSFESETELARTALDARKKSDPNYRQHSEEKIRNLQQKFHRNLGEWVKSADSRSSMAESVFQVKLDELYELLTPLGLRMVYPKELLRDAKGPI